MLVTTKDYVVVPIAVVLNFSINLGRINILTILGLWIHKHSTPFSASFHLFDSCLLSLFKALWFSMCTKVLHIFGQFHPEIASSTFNFNFQ